MENYEMLAQAIVEHQESVVGPLAWSEAEKVKGLSVKGNNISISGNGKSVLGELVSQYENLFGQASVEACRDAVRPLMPKLKGLELPSNLA